MLLCCRGTKRRDFSVKWTQHHKLVLVCACWPDVSGWAAGWEWRGRQLMDVSWMDHCSDWLQHRLQRGKIFSCSFLFPVLSLVLLFSVTKGVCYLISKQCNPVFHSYFELNFTCINWIKAYCCYLYALSGIQQKTLSIIPCPLKKVFLWCFDMPGVTLSEGFCEELQDVFPADSLAFVLSRRHRRCLMCTSHCAPLRPLFPTRRYVHLFADTRTDSLSPRSPWC